MLFIRHSPGPSPGVPGSPAARTTADTQSVGSRGGPQQQGRAWALKSFATGVSVLGLAYCLIQVAGFQYVASLTTITLLAFLLVYLVWCATSRRRNQLHGVDGTIECGTTNGASRGGFLPSDVSLGTGAAYPRGSVRGRPTPLPSCSSAVELHDAALLRSLAAAGVLVGPPEWKPPRAVTPPPTYEEAMRAAPPTPPPPPPPPSPPSAPEGAVQTEMPATSNI